MKAAELKVEVEFDFIGPAFVEEDFEVSLSIRNDDIMELEVFLDILLQPEVDDSGLSGFSCSVRLG